MGETPLLMVRNVWKAFGGIQAVSGVNFAVCPGEVRAVIGPNGAGKTTLFNLLTGQMGCDEGRIVFRGNDIKGLSPHRISRLGMGRTFQVPATFRSLTVRDSVRVAVLSREGKSNDMISLASRLAEERVDALLADVGLVAYAESVCATLSLGDVKRVELALALAGGPSLLLLDEPTAGMSGPERSELVALLSRIVREKAVSVLFTEHDMDVVFGIATTVLVMHQGRVLAEGAPGEIRAHPEVQRVYLGETDE